MMQPVSRYRSFAVKKNFEQIKSAILEMLLPLDPEFVYLFGSYVKGGCTSQSDLDVAIFLEKDIDAYELFMKAQKMSSVLGIDVDLVQLRPATTVFQKEVVGGGTVLYEKSRLQREMFEMNVIKKYLRLNEERKEIIDSLYAHA